MPAHRYFTSSPLKVHEQIQLDREESRHFIRVMRGKVGQLIELVNGQGKLAYAECTEIANHIATCRIVKQQTFPCTGPRLILAQAFPRLSRLDLILEKGTELGAAAFWLFPGSYSEIQELTPERVKRSHRILVAALKQSGRLYLPQLQIYPPLAEWARPSCPAYYGDLNPDAPPLVHCLERDVSIKEALFFIGPESGFAQEELDRLHHLGVQGVKLHANILRTDTAPLAALALIYHLLDR